MFIRLHWCNDFYRQWVFQECIAYCKKSSFLTFYRQIWQPGKCTQWKIQLGIVISASNDPSCSFASLEHHLSSTFHFKMGAGSYGLYLFTFQIVFYLPVQSYSERALTCSSDLAIVLCWIYFVHAAIPKMDNAAAM